METLSVENDGGFVHLFEPDADLSVSWIETSDAYCRENTCEEES
jgi:hypothetical protein